MRRTPDPAALSLAFKVTVTFELFQPEAGVGEIAPPVDGGIVSEAPGCTIGGLLMLFMQWRLNVKSRQVAASHVGASGDLETKGKH